MNLVPMLKSEFDSLDGPRKLNESTFSVSYYKIDFGSPSGVFGIGCSNNLALPTIIDHQDWWIGVDCELAVIGKLSGRILLRCILPSPFQFFSHFDDLTTVACETDVLVFNKDKTLRTFANLGDVISQVKREEGALSVTTLNGKTAIVRI